MNRIKFMTELAALLQDVPAEERRDAMKFYNDYFDDAGEENEQRVIEELESPAKVAATIKADLRGSSGEYGEYTEKGYTDTRFEYKETPAGRNIQKEDGGYRKEEQGYNYEENTYRGFDFRKKEEEPRTNGTLKVILIILLVIVGAPIVIPVAIAVIAVVAACAFALLMVFISLVIASVAVAFAGVCVFIAGVLSLIPEIAVGLALVGTGLILTAFGVIGTVISLRVCWIVIPGIVRGCVWLLRQPFQRKAVV
ncbi:MAG: DUF1700 domain-containing protein [Dorea sp.]|jgi:uncharacterized membrane protein|nr:DUF1700 domain-containing protein [Dorea sp.]